MTGLGVQEQAIYVCDPGFVIVGLLVRICLDNGEWGGDDPTCTSEQHDRQYMNGSGGGGSSAPPLYETLMYFTGGRCLVIVLF